MKIGVLGSGNVGQALAKGFIDQGHDVWLATREPESDKGAALKKDFASATVCDFAMAAKEGELLVLCTPWHTAQETIELAGKENLADKVVIDTNNMINRDTMTYAFQDKSAAEQVQEWLPDSQVVKAFNSVGAVMMYRPQLSATPTMFIAGNDADAKRQVADIVTSFGWEPLDSGDIVCAREIEAMALIWIRNSIASGDPHHAFKLL